MNVLPPMVMSKSGALALQSIEYSPVRPPAMGLAPTIWAIFLTSALGPARSEVPESTMALTAVVADFSTLKESSLTSQ